VLIPKHAQMRLYEECNWGKSRPYGQEPWQ
jgi:hypothetical protein